MVEAATSFSARGQQRVPIPTSPTDKPLQFWPKSNESSRKKYVWCGGEVNGGVGRRP